MKFKRWNIAAAEEKNVSALRGAGYPYLLSLVLAGRGVSSPEEAAVFLDHDLSLTLSPCHKHNTFGTHHGIKSHRDSQLGSIVNTKELTRLHISRVIC